MSRDATIKVNRRENPFTQIDRKLINDKRLSLDTRLMLIWLIDKPPGWKTTIGSLVTLLPAGRSVVRRMIRESEKFGYIERITDRKQGRFVYDYEVNEQPLDKEITPPCAVSRRGSADAVQPTRFSRRGKLHTNTNTVYRNTDQTNTDQTKTDHHHQVELLTTPNDDDDDGSINLSLSPHFLVAKEIAETMPEWTGAETFMLTLDEGQLIALTTWLYLWFLGKHPEEMSKYRRWPLAGVENVVGKIITQARAGNVAPLIEEHRELLSDELKERMKS